MPRLFWGVTAASVHLLDYVPKDCVVRSPDKADSHCEMGWASFYLADPHRAGRLTGDVCECSDQLVGTIVRDGKGELQSLPRSREYLVSVLDWGTQPT